jgi:TatA/E family protein of Tat protein translocase
MNLGGPEILVILVVALLVFGPNRLPEIGKQLGKALREFRKVEERVKSELSGVLDLEGTDAKVDDQSLAPQYGDPTNVPDQPEPAPQVSREVPTAVDEHNEPPPIIIEPDEAETAEPDADDATTSDAPRPATPPAS